jgi:hypothetical protein
MGGAPDELFAELTKTLQLLEKNKALHSHFRKHEFPLLGRKDKPRA